MGYTLVVVGAAALGAVAGSVFGDVSTFLGRFDFGVREYTRQPALQEHYRLIYERFKHWAAAVTESELASTNG